MVQGIAFLSKKSWHTKNLANQEKVWIAEQRKAAEESKTKELARQITQEREQEEMDRLAGKKTHLDRGIDWMYQGQAAGGDEKPSELETQDAEKRAEEFLLGKEYVSKGAPVGDFAEASRAAEGVNVVVRLEDLSAATATGTGEDTVAARNEAFRQRLEDPMFMVSRIEHEKRVEMEKQKALYERVLGPVAAMEKEDSDVDGRDRKKKSSSKHDRKHERKERRRREKEERKRKRREAEDHHERKRHLRRDDSDEESEDSRDRRHSRKKDKYYSENDSTGDNSLHHRQSSRKRSRSRDEEDRKSRRSGRRRTNRSPSLSLDDSPRQRHRSGHYISDRQNRDTHQFRDERKIDHERGEHRNSSHIYRREEHHHQPIKKTGYGLLGKTSSRNEENYSAKDLGPAQELLRQKRLAVEEERRQAKERANSRRPLTAEERARALEEMKAEAQLRSDRDAARRPAREDEESVPAMGKANFIKDMTEQAHGIKGSVQSLASRMQSNRYNQQRLHDDSFL